jgi:multidrug efflux pump
MSPPVDDDTENVRQAAWMNDVPAVIVNIQRQPGANIISVVDRVKLLAAVHHIAAEIGPGRHSDRQDQHHSGVGAGREFELMLTVGWWCW